MNYHNTLARFVGYVSFFTDLFSIEDAKLLVTSQDDAHHFVKIDDLCKSYEEGGSRNAVLTSVNCTIAKGDSVALLGSSGSGKSTLLNVIAGIDIADQGRIEIGGTRLDALDEAGRTHWRRQNLGFVFQFFNLIPTLSVEENVTLPLQLKGAGQERQRRRVRELLMQVGLGERGRSFPENLSGGEQQRVAIARALAHEPMLVLADEPTGNLDGATGAHVLQLMLDLTAHSATTLIIATHSQAVSERVKRILHLEQGKLVEGAA